MHEARARRISGPSDVDFLERFKSLGWFLDDLSLEPVNGLAPAARKAACRAARSSLAARIAQYPPKAIVTLLVGIGGIVETAAVEAGSDAPRYVVPFPGISQQVRFARPWLRSCRRCRGRGHEAPAWRPARRSRPAPYSAAAAIQLASCMDDCAAKARLPRGGVEAPHSSSTRWRHRDDEDHREPENFICER